MRCRILHESNGRMRVHVMQSRMTPGQADLLQYFLQGISGIDRAVVHERTMNVILFYLPGRRDEAVKALAEFRYETCTVSVPENTGRVLQREFEDRLFFLIARRCVTALILPEPISMIVTAVRSVPFLIRGFRCLAKGKLEVPVLDATSIAVSMLNGDFDTAGNIMFLLGIGSLLEDWTHRKSVDDLAQRMALHVDRVWMKTGNSETLVPVNQVEPGDEIVVRTGGVIPLDGVVDSGEASVNQASMTGESMPVCRTQGGYVYAGTVVEEGEITVTVKLRSGNGRYDRIVGMIEESEKLKSASVSRAEHLADRLVPWSLGGTILTWLLTKNVQRTLSVLMVDYSCALKLAMPISVMSAMREASEHKIDVKGGKFLEAVSEAKTIIFDKTGTLTHATPHVREVVTFDGNDETEMLQLAACLEEHFPHPIANAVVQEAKKRGLDHAERHTKVEYVVAHGIASTIDGRRVVIGSRHFVMEDEHSVVPRSGRMDYNHLPEECSLLYMAIGGRLSAVLCIEDPIRAEAAEVVRGLHKLGIDKVVMMTGDSERTAKAVAAQVGVDAYQAEVLPEDKAALIREEHKKGRKAIMVGDGINDSPAISEADAGVAVAAGAAIAREIADITISASDLREILVLRELSDALTKRINQNYRTILGFNTLLILLGVTGIMMPTTAALLHNASTLTIALRSMTDLLET